MDCFIRKQNKKEIKLDWIFLFLGGIFEAGFAFCLGMTNKTEGVASVWWFVGFIISLSISMLLLIKATQTLPLGTAYAVWTGIGALLTLLIGIVVFKEPTDFWRIFFICTLIASVVGLKFVSN